jgi:Cu/Ag efflux protein CusF
MKLFRTAILATVLAVGASAHDGGEDVTGIIQKVDANTVSVKTTKGKMVDIKLAADTEYTRGKAAAKVTDLKTGDRVVVHAMEMKGALTAHLVQLPVAKPAAKKAK